MISGGFSRATYIPSFLTPNNFTYIQSKKFGVPASSKLAHDIWCTPFYGVHSTLNLVCYAHHFWCGKHTLYQCATTFCPRLAFTHVNMYNIDTIQLQSSHEQYSKCVVLLSNVFVRYFVADIQSNCYAAPPETYA